MATPILVPSISLQESMRVKERKDELSNTTHQTLFDPIPTLQLFNQLYTHIYCSSQFDNLICHCQLTLTLPEILSTQHFDYQHTTHHPFTSILSPTPHINRTTPYGALRVISTQQQLRRTITQCWQHSSLSFMCGRTPVTHNNTSCSIQHIVWLQVTILTSIQQSYQ